MDRSEDLHSLLGLMILGQDDRTVGRSVIDLSNVLHSLLVRLASRFMRQLILLGQDDRSVGQFAHVSRQGQCDKWVGPMVGRSDLKLLKF